ncbi:hypothetical protein [Maricaulis sp.]|uniref:hypothetical protein n=1 Tax=Maricaulis sp. TaxID=1486257 RepID=UPI00261C800F|nr:hypothetical protein [Maricaulis sp.]
MSAYPAQFIHFGLPKCGSTFLQSVWGEDKQYTAANLAQAANAARQLAAKGQLTGLPRLDIGLRARPGTKMVASSEGFSWAYMDQPQLLPKIADLHRVAASLTGAAKLSETALFVVRNPVNWIRSAHEQSIKEGGFGTGAEFLQSHRALIENVLDLAHIRDTYGQHFKRVVFLSADEMRHQPEAFWARYERVLGAPIPKDAAIQRVAEDDSYSNVSLRERMVLLARMNKVMRGVAEAWAGFDPVPPHVAKEREHFLAPFNQARLWAARRVSELSSAEELEAILGGAHADIADGFTDLPLGDDLKAHLRTHFCDVIDSVDTIPDTLKSEYRDALA